MIIKWLSFSIDIPSFVTFIQATLGQPKAQVAASRYDMRIISAGGVPTKDQQAAINAYLAGLTEAGEASKRAKPSRILTGPRSNAWVAVKSAIAAKDLNTLNAAEKKLFMGLDLTMDEMDTLTIPAS